MMLWYQIMLDEGWSVQRAACSVQRAACSVQRAACSVQRAACSVQRAACSVQRAACSVQRAACSVQRAARHTSTERNRDQAWGHMPAHQPMGQGAAQYAECGLKPARGSVGATGAVRAPARWRRRMAARPEQGNCAKQGLPARRVAVSDEPLQRRASAPDAPRRWSGTCPPHVRINQTNRNSEHCVHCVPYARGDEPSFGSSTQQRTPVFPTRVGMNRRSKRNSGYGTGVPYARGDEPCSASNASADCRVFPTRVGMNRFLQ